jgi:nucleoside-diphosphate-sugar epimerase
MKVLVTGGSGIVGRYVVDELSKAHSVEVLDLKMPHRTGFTLHTVDVLDLPALNKIVTGFDAVVHLAGIPHPLNEPHEKVFRVNTLGTYNMLEAASANRVKQFILMSSESTLGFAFSTKHNWPEYAPIDEHHPLRPQDAYGLSKVACELLCAGASRKSEIQTVCLRAPWIWVPEEKAFYRQLIDEYRKWYKNLWAFIHVYDVAQTIRHLIEQAENTKLKLPRHDAYFICAEQNWTGRDSRELLAEFYPETKTFSKDFSGAASILSSTKAKQAFGFAPQYSTKDIF